MRRGARLADLDPKGAENLFEMCEKVDFEEILVRSDLFLAGRETGPYFFQKRWFGGFELDV